MAVPRAMAPALPKNFRRVIIIICFLMVRIYLKLEMLYLLAGFATIVICIGSFINLLAIKSPTFFPYKAPESTLSL